MCTVFLILVLEHLTVFQISELSSEQWEKFVESWRKQMADVNTFDFISNMILMC